MSRPDKRTRELLALTVPQRLERACIRTDRMVDLARTLDQAHRTNQIVLYTPTLGAQIPRSGAAYAFEQFRQSLYLFELIRLAAMWDDYGGDRESIPEVVRLLDDPLVIEAAKERARGRYANLAPMHIVNEADLDPGTVDDLQRWHREDQERVANAKGVDAEAGIRDAIWRCQEVVISPEIHALRDLRDRAIAHNLQLPDPNEEAAPARWRYGGETDLMALTVELVDRLQLSLNSSSFDWADMRRQHRRNAEELWNGCRFNIPDRSQKLSTD